MNIQARINQIEKRASKRFKKDDFRTILFTTKDEDGKKYDYFDWSENGQFNEIGKSRYENKEGITVFVNMAYGYVPPSCRREDYG